MTRPRKNPTEGAIERAQQSRSTRWQAAGFEFVVLSWPLSLQLDSLTAAELEVVMALVRGHSNEGIAATRGRSAKTVANQVQSIYRKLGVSSRAELVAKISAAPRPSAPGESD